MKGKFELYNRLSEMYKNRQIDRKRIFEKYNISIKTITNAIRKRKIEIWDKIRKYDKEFLDEIKKLISQGKYIEEIAEEKKVDNYYLRLTCDRHRIKYKSLNEEKRNDYERRRKEIKQLLKKGESINSIIKKVGVNSSTVYKIMYENDIIIQKEKEIKDSSKYYHPKNDTSRYAKMIYYFNK